MAQHRLISHYLHALENYRPMPVHTKIRFREYLHKFGLVLELAQRLSWGQFHVDGRFAGDCAHGWP